MISSHTHRRRRRGREKRREKESGTKNVAKFWARQTFLRRALLFLHANDRTTERALIINLSLSLSLDFISKKRQERSFVRVCLWDRSRYFLVFFQSKTFLLFLFKKAVKKHQERERETLLFKNLLYYKSNPRKNATEEEEEEEEEL
jgi:hypothetical protein